MTDLTRVQLLAAGLHALIALVWVIIARREVSFMRTYQARSPLFVCLRNLTVLGAVFYAVQALLRLTPPELAAAPPAWLFAIWLLGEWALMLLAATTRHLVRYWGMRRDPPTTAWLVVNYGAAGLMMAFALFSPELLAGSAHLVGTYLAIRNAFTIVFFGLAVREMVGVARSGRWRPGAAGNVVRRLDVVLFGAALLGVLAWVAIPLLGRPPPAVWGLVIDMVIALAVTTPLAAREMHAVVRGVFVAVGTLAAASAVYLGGSGLLAPIAAAGMPHLVTLIAIVALTATVASMPPLLRRLVDRFALGRHRHVWADLQAFLATLSPEAGVMEICRQALTEVVRVCGLTGAAIMLRDGEAVSVGDFALEPLRDAWPRGADFDRLPPSIISADFVRDLPLPALEAMAAAEVIGVIPLTSPRRRWGTLFATSGLIEPSPDDVPSMEAFAAQLTLVLDAAALIERTVAVERSLAHAEKLAAIGELAARIAHEIRNPVTAARSLAQLLARDPTAPENTEHAQLILGELERVERQVRALLQFARREEYRLEPVDVGELVRVSLGPLRPRLADANVTVVDDLPADVVVRADREKLRQVLVNLIENALDALTTSPDGRHLALSAATENGTVTLRVSDSGPGVPDDALPRLFEPFFSLKAGGTGLGLAIARRTIEAHGGRIAAEPVAPHGVTFRIDLPSGAR